MKREYGIARCGLACCLCSENTTCQGCLGDNCEMCIRDRLKSIKTGDSGIAEFSNLLYGTYYVRETGAPKGYYLSTEIKTVEVNKDSGKTNALPFVFTDVKKPTTGKFSVLKRDKDTAEGLQGAEFKVVGINVQYDKTYMTDQNGTFTTDELVFGEYRVCLLYTSRCV